jgi:exonuclease III
MRFGTWNIRSLRGRGAIKTIAGELGKYKLDLVCVQEVRWEKGCTKRAEDFIFLMEKGMGSSVGTGFFRT